MLFEKQLLELQEMIRRFLEIHENPYDTSKHNETAEKLENYFGNKTPFSNE